MKEKLVVLAGPTATGKTDLSIAIAKALNGEIISADSMQIYRYMDIGTAKVSRDEMEGIPHHLIDFLDPDHEFSVAMYSEYAKSLISEINEKGKLPIVVGGTGLYINSLVYDLEFGRIEPLPGYRAELEMIYTKSGGQYLLDMLKKVDEESASRLGPKDKKRIIRALEVYKATGESLSSQGGSFRKETARYELSFYCLNMDREKLYDRINHRVDLMMDKGLTEEVKNLLLKGYHRELQSMQAIGYKEICQYLYGECTLDEAVNRIKQGSRNYAKRQLTWFRRDNRIKWVDIDTFDDKADLFSFLINDIERLNDKEGL
jgi:tRNA dimethylallyltransferase